MRVFSVSISGPGISCSRSCRPPTRRRGRTARARTMIPIPPSHWVSWRQKSRPRGSASTFVSTLPPVVLNPDMPSKYASTGRSSCGSPERMNGSAPSVAAASHVSATTRKPSRIPSRWSPRVPYATASPTVAPIAPAPRNGSGDSPYPAATAAGTRVAALRYATSVPTMLSAARTSTARNGVRSRRRAATVFTVRARRPPRAAIR